MDMRSDRRRFPRAPLQVRVEVIGKEQPSRTRCWAEDISEGGIRLRETTVPHFAAVEVRFALPPDEEVTRIDGTVAWRRVSGTGVRFAGISDEQRCQLRNYVALNTDR